MRQEYEKVTQRKYQNSIKLPKFSIQFMIRNKPELSKF